MTEYLAFDIGALNTKYALIDANGEIKEKGIELTPKNKIDDLLTLLEKIVNSVQEDIAGIAISTSGKINEEKSTVQFSWVLPILNDFNFKNTLEDKYHVPVIVMDSGRAATLGEQSFGVMKDTNSGIVLTLGTDLGCGVIINKQLLKGKSDQAGKINYLIVDDKSGLKNMMGSAGWQCSAVNLVRTINRKLNNIDLLDPKTAFAAIKVGNVEATKIFQQYCRLIAKMILNIALLLDVDKFVIAGELATQEILIEEIKQQLMALLESNPMMMREFTAPKIDAAQNPSTAQLLGAVASLIKENEK